MSQEVVRRTDRQTDTRAARNLGFETQGLGFKSCLRLFPALPLRQAFIFSAGEMRVIAPIA